MAQPLQMLQRVSDDDLYRRWEKGNWSATEIDFSEDRRQWQEQFGELERRAALWNYAMSFHGEDSVADNLSPFIDAAPREEQKYFLATQQVDEARHAIFFGRFMREVVENGDSYASSLTPRGRSSRGDSARCSSGSTRWPTSCAAIAPAPSSHRGSRSTTS